MLRKLLSTLIVSLIVISAFSSCGNPGANGKLVLPIDSEPAYLDPQIISDDGARMIMLNCMEGLMSYDADGNLVPAAADSFDISSDGLVYTFRLRSDGRWRVTTLAGAILGEDYAETFDTRVTAADFAFALKRAIEPSTICPSASLLMNIKNAVAVHEGSADVSRLGVRATDDYTLKITLERRDDDFLSVLAEACCLPCNEIYFNATGGRYGLSTSYLIYNGPFYISNWADGTSISLRRNYLYHDLGDDAVAKEVLPSSVYFSFNSEQATRDRKLRDETYHLAFLTDSQAEELNGNKRVKIKGFASSMLTLMFNCGDEIVSNAKLRMAVAHGLDYKVFEEYGERASSLLPHGLLLGGVSARNAVNIELLESNRKLAGKLFAQALDELEKNRIKLTLLCDADDEMLARTAIQSLQSTFGVVFGIEVETADSETLQKRIASGDYQIVLNKLRFSGSSAKAALRAFASNNSANHAFFSSAAYDRLLDEVCTAGSKKETAKAVRRAEKYLTDRAVIIPLVTESTLYGVSSKCEGVIFYPSGEVALFKQTAVR